MDALYQKVKRLTYVGLTGRLTETEIHEMMHQMIFEPDENEKRFIRKYLEIVQYIPHWKSCFSGQVENDFFTQIIERFHCHQKGNTDSDCNEAERLLKEEEDIERHTNWNPLGLEGRKRKNKSKTSKKTKKDDMSVDCKRRKLEEIEDQVTDQFTVKLLEEENIEEILKKSSEKDSM
jgi:hypothetical protein